jgi:5-methylcytosine-specific restriction protein B
MDERSTTSTQSGLYCVYLFREDCSGVYLTIAQGVTEPQKRLGTLAGRAEMRDRARQTRSNLRGLASRGFSLDDTIDLHTGPGLGTEYEVSTIAHKLYQQGEVPSDEVLLADLHEVLAGYEGVIDKPEKAGGTLPSPNQLAQAFSAMLRSSGLDYGAHHEIVATSFLASILTKPLVLLTGMTGSGKTQIALKLGQWLGDERRLVAPVRPDWTGPESVFGYEDGLAPRDEHGRRPWYVPAPLELMLRASQHPSEPHVLILDEMNLAHVERYFADFLSGMETGEPTLPNLVKEDGHWKVASDGIAEVPVPRNLFVIGTVNVDETTYAFSPKVLDRAQTLEFRVETKDLTAVASRPTTPQRANSDQLALILAISGDPDWHLTHQGAHVAELAAKLQLLHTILARSDLEFGHRTYFEAIRFGSIYSALGRDSWTEALDLIILQKILPRVHGTRTRVESPLQSLERFSYSLEDSEAGSQEGEGTLPLSLNKLRRMLRLVRTNQFVSFTE